MTKSKLTKNRLFCSAMKGAGQKPELKPKPKQLVCVPISLKRPKLHSLLRKNFHVRVFGFPETYVMRIGYSKAEWQTVTFLAGEDVVAQYRMHKAATDKLAESVKAAGKDEEVWWAIPDGSERVSWGAGGERLTIGQQLFV